MGYCHLVVIVGAVKYYCCVVCTTTASRAEHYWSMPWSTIGRRSKQ